MIIHLKSEHPAGNLPLGIDYLAIDRRKINRALTQQTLWAKLFLLITLSKFFDHL